LEGAAAHEDRRPAEHSLLGGPKQMVAPANGVTQCLLARGRIPWAAGECAPGSARLSSAEPSGQPCPRQMTSPSGGQLKRQRQAVEVTTDGFHHAGIGIAQGKTRLSRLGSLYEEPYRRGELGPLGRGRGGSGGQRQGRHGKG